jgi:mono/diheme cytochrome c family protein
MSVRDLAFVIAALALGCGSRQRGEPHGPPVTAATQGHEQGRMLFQRHCYKCHPNGTTGLGPALNDKPLPEVAVRTQIRQGVGAMPSFGDDQLSDEDVAAIASYVSALRNAPVARAQ